MNITNRIPKTVEDIFSDFKFDLDLSSIKSAVCIAYQNLGGNDTRAVYEIYVNDLPRFFAASVLEYPESASNELNDMQMWTEAKSIKLLDEKKSQGFNLFLFELDSPFGIYFQ